jgi:hypothetical protein
LELDGLVAAAAIAATAGGEIRLHAKTFMA